MKQEDKDIAVGIFPNKNGRIYSMDDLRKMKAVINEANAKGSPMLGELEMRACSMIDLNRVSHRIENARIEGLFLKADIVVLPTPMGNILNSLLDSGLEMCYRSRGFGKIDEHGNVTDFEFVSIDAVNPDTAA